MSWQRSIEQKKNLYLILPDCTFLQLHYDVIISVIIVKYLGNLKITKNLICPSTY